MKKVTRFCFLWVTEEESVATYLLSLAALFSSSSLQLNYHRLLEERVFAEDIIFASRFIGQAEDSLNLQMCLYLLVACCI